MSTGSGAVITTSALSFLCQGEEWGARGSGSENGPSVNRRHPTNVSYRQRLQDFVVVGVDTLVTHERNDTLPHGQVTWGVNPIATWLRVPPAFMPSISYQFNIMREKKIVTLNQAKTIGEQLGISWDKFDLEQFRAGLGVELEHGTVNQTTNVTNDDPLMTGKIALAHLTEFPDYYSRLAKMEEEAKSFWDSKNS
jgi:Protein of unknown function (DUF5661)